MSQHDESSLFLKLAASLRAARAVTVLTGAGVSAESGLPTFRDAMTGLWKKYRPEDLATVDAFQRDPKLVWDWYAMRRAQAQDAAPNAAHDALAAMQRLVPEFTLITQNVDGLHQRAGSTEVIELHGSLFRLRCVNDGMIYSEWTEREDGPPCCPQCGNLLRPDVVWFGETIGSKNWQAAVEATTQCDAFISIGTSGSVYPAAALISLAAQYGASCAVINQDELVSPPISVRNVLGKADEILPKLVRSAWLDAASYA